MKTSLITVFVSAFFYTVSSQVAFAQKDCDENPLKPRIDKLMEKQLPLVFALKNTPGKPKFSEPAIRILAYSKKALEEFHKLREAACVLVAKQPSNPDPKTENENSIGPPKSCDDISKRSEAYLKAENQNNEISDELNNLRDRLPLIYETYVNAAYNTFKQVLVRDEQDVQQRNAAYKQMKEVWNSKDEKGLFRKEAVNFFDEKIIYYSSVANDAHFSAGELKIRLHELGCEQGSKD